MRAENLFGQHQLPGRRMGGRIGSRLGQAVSRPMTGIGFSYNEAAKWLADAEKTVSQIPACNLPIVGRFRDFVNKTASEDRLGARLNLTPLDMQGMDDFSQCSQQSQTLDQAAAAQAAQDAAKKTQNYAAMAGAGIALLGLGYFIAKA